MDQDKIEKLESFEEAKYENIDLDHLIMYVMDQLAKMGVDLSFENAVVASFKLFPRKFSLIRFSNYPDSNRVEQCLWRCTYKTKQWLGGKSRRKHYVGENGQYKKALPSQVFLADLIAERCFYEIAKKKVDSSGALIRPEARLDKIQSETYVLSRKHGKKVHEVLVDQDLLKIHQRHI